jgi:GDP-4-dehydro-6-deoxy-D-mannose reductase
MLRGTGGVLHTGNTQVFRDFIDVEHVAMALRRLTQNADARGVVNVCSGQATELRRLVEMLIDVSGKNIVTETISSRLRPGECRAVVGSTTLLARLGAAPPQTDYADAVARIWHDAETRWVAAL